MKKERKGGKPFGVWSMTADPYNAGVVVCVGDIEECIRVVERDYGKDCGEPLRHLADTCPPVPPGYEGGLVPVGRVNQFAFGDVFIYFPAWPRLKSLVHELLHAVQYVLTSAGVKDSEGEADAYLLAFLFDGFTVPMRRQMEEEGVKWV